MAITHKLEPHPQQTPYIALLNELLAGVIDLAMEAKHAHWNVRGENFIAIHELFDRVAKETADYADLIAERLGQMGEAAPGTLREVLKNSKLPAYSVNVHESQQHIRELSRATGVLADSLRTAIDSASDNNDAVTADLLTEVTRGLDKLRWLLESHISA